MLLLILPLRSGKHLHANLGPTHFLLKVIPDGRRGGKLHLEALSRPGSEQRAWIGSFVEISTCNTMGSDSAFLPKSSKYKNLHYYPLPSTYTNQPQGPQRREIAQPLGSAFLPLMWEGQAHFLPVIRPLEEKVGTGGIIFLRFPVSFNFSQMNTCYWIFKMAMTATFKILTSVHNFSKPWLSAVACQSCATYLVLMCVWTCSDYPKIGGICAMHGGFRSYQHVTNIQGTFKETSLAKPHRRQVDSGGQQFWKLRWQQHSQDWEPA